MAREFFRGKMSTFDDEMAFVWNFPIKNHAKWEISNTYIHISENELMSMSIIQLYTLIP